MKPAKIIAILLFGVLLSTSLQAQQASQLLHQRIDEAVASQQPVSTSLLATDAEFMRRLYLDLLGTVPRLEEAKAFLNDTSENRREKLVERLINDPRLNHHMAVAFDVMLMERTADSAVKTPQWRQYLYESFANNKPYNVLAREILSAGGTDPELRVPSKFYLDRKGETNRLTRDVGRIFLGRDMQCAQCHDHPLIDTYYQADYYGLFAFLNRSQLFVNAAKTNYFAEKSVGNVSFKSVFTEEAGETGPQLPGDNPVVEPYLQKLDEYQVRPNGDRVSKPVYSRRQQLAELATNGGNAAFNRNIANRLWGMMNGRALVMPVDLDHPANPPSNPALMKVLEEAIVELNFDVKQFLKHIALSKTYQRSFDLGTALQSSPANLKARISEVTELKARTDEQAYAALDKWEAKLEELKTLRVKYAEVRKTYIDADTAAATQLDKYLAQDGAVFAAQTAIDKQIPLRDSFLAAHVSILKVLESLPGDAVAKDAAAKFKVKLDASVAAIAKQTDVKKKAEEQGKKEQDALTPLQETLNKAYMVWQPAKEEIYALEIQEQALRNEFERLQTLVTAYETQEYEFGKILANAELKQEMIAGRQKVNSNTAEVKASELVVGRLKAEVLQAQSEMTSAVEAKQSAVSQMTKATVARNKKSEAIELLVAVIETTNTATSTIAEDPLVLVTRKELSDSEVKLKAELTALDAAVQTATQEVSTKTKTADAIIGKVKAMVNKLAVAEADYDQAQQSLAASLKTAVDLSSRYQESTEKLSRQLVSQFVVSDLRALSPEQLANAMMESMGVTQVYRTSTIAELDKAKPMSDADKNDRAKMIQREREISDGVEAKIDPIRSDFVKLYGAGAGQVQTDFFSTIDQALYITNGSRLTGWLGSNSYLVGQLEKLEDSAQIAEDLYVSVLSRKPSAAEVERVQGFLSGVETEKKQAIQDMVWALLASAEFRFNH
ncbi:MAG: DUF1549 domain-containing protein [Planctomycetota bacterium]|nr:DUF1549 domain-containing protein [Planctomycetota bacterium]